VKGIRARLLRRRSLRGRTGGRQYALVYRWLNVAARRGMVQLLPGANFRDKGGALLAEMPQCSQLAGRSGGGSSEETGGRESASRSGEERIDVWLT
jgi:hypothetical protein